MVYRQYGVPQEGVTLGMVQANISLVKDGHPGIGVFVRSIVVRCTVCDDTFLVSENGDTPMRCAKHRRVV